MKSLWITGAAIILAGQLGLAQDIPAETSDSTTTATSAASRDKQTTQSPIVAFHYSDEMFEKRWEKEAEIYREADIPEEKIQKLHDLKYQQWEARRTGEKIDYGALVRKSSQVLTREEMAKMRKIRDEKIRADLSASLTNNNSVRTTNGKAVIMQPANTYSTTATAGSTADTNADDESATGTQEAQPQDE